MQLQGENTAAIRAMLRSAAPAAERRARAGPPRSRPAPEALIPQLSIKFTPPALLLLLMLYHTGHLI